MFAGGWTREETVVVGLGMVLSHFDCDFSFENIPEIYFYEHENVESER